MYINKEALRPFLLSTLDILLPGNKIKPETCVTAFFIAAFIHNILNESIYILLLNWFLQ